MDDSTARGTGIQEMEIDMDSRLLKYYTFDVIADGLKTTLIILVITMIITIIFGIILGSILYTTDKEGLTPELKLNFVLGIIVNVIRSVPTIIFMVLMIPVTRIVIGSAIGIPAAIFSISVMGIPFMARIVEGRLKEVDKNLIEAAKSMGMSNLQILVKYVIHSAVPSLVLSFSFATVIFLGVIASAGTIGAGGIGAVAMNYGYKVFNDYVMYCSIFVLAVLVIVIQFTGRLLYRKLK